MIPSRSPHYYYCYIVDMTLMLGTQQTHKKKYLKKKSVVWCQLAVPPPTTSLMTREICPFGLELRARDVNSRSVHWLRSLFSLQVFFFSIVTNTFEAHIEVIVRRNARRHRQSGAEAGEGIINSIRNANNNKMFWKLILNNFFLLLVLLLMLLGFRVTSHLLLRGLWRGLGLK